MEDYYMQKPSQVITNVTQSVEYNLYLHGKIGEPDNFMEHFAVYKTAGQDDLIRLYINSEGGNVGTGMEYIRHMRECNCPIVAVLGFDVSSMASAIALQADEIEVDEMSTMLIHSFSYGAAGNEASIFNQAKFNNKLNERWIRKYYSNFLDEDQLSDVFKGVDILLDSDEIIERWEVYQEARYAEVRDQVEHQSKTLEELVKDAVKEAMAELNESAPKVENVINISADQVEAFNAYDITKVLDQSRKDVGCVGLLDEDKMPCDGQTQNGLPDGKSPETAYPYWPDSALEKGVWYKWEATEDSECPLLSDQFSDLVFGDDSKWHYQDPTGFFWNTLVAEYDDVVKYFKIL